MRSAGAVVLAAATALAQTTIAPLQLREWSALETSPSQIRLYAVYPSKQGVIQVRPGAGLTLRTKPEGWVLEAVTPPAPEVYQVDRRLTRDAFGNYKAPSRAVIVRNGIAVEEGEDYRREGEFVIPIPEPWPAIDKVRAIYLDTKPPIASLAPEKSVLPVPSSILASDQPQYPQYLGPDPWPPGARLGQGVFKVQFRKYDKPLPPATRVNPSQMHNWAQLRNPNSSGTSLALDQIDNLAEVASFWQAQAESQFYPEYRVAIIDRQELPILITCQASPCDQSWPLWFRSSVK